jgi:capsular exopolysaccharide synthesis family protein
MAEGGNSVVSIAEYTGVLNRWARVILTVSVVGAAIGTLLVVASPGQFTADATVQIRPILSEGDEPDLDSARQINVDTEVAIAGSQRVAERALALRAAADGLDTTDLAAPDVLASALEIPADPTMAREAAERVEVSVVPDSQILVFAASADDPGQARALAQSTAIAYLDFRRDEATLSNESSRARLEDREAQLLVELDGRAGGGAANPDALAFADVAPRSELDAIGTKYANLGSLTVDPGVVLTDAAVPVARDGLPLPAGPVIGGLLGLIASLTGVFLIDRSDDRLRSSRVELRALGAPLLGTAPIPAEPSAGQIDLGGSRLFPVNTEASDAYRRLHGSLLFNLDSDDKSVVLVAGVNDPAAATSVAANVAATAARAGRRTLVVGADLRNDTLGSHLGSAAGDGLSDVILRGVSLAETIESVDEIGNLSVLRAGNCLDRPTDVLQSAAFARLMAAVQADYELVVVEAPPVLRVADAVDVAKLCDGAVIVADGGSESRQAIAESVEQLRSIGSDIVGVVVADAS